MKDRRKAHDSAQRTRVSGGTLIVGLLGWAAPVLLLAALLSPLVLPDWSREENRNSEDLIFIPLALGLLSVVAAALAILSGMLLLLVRRRLPIQVAVPVLWSVLVLLLVGIVV